MNQLIFENPSIDGYTIILDACNFQSTISAIKNGKDPKKIYLFQFNENEYNYMMKNNVYGVNIIRGNVDQLISKFNKIDHSFLDYCSSKVEHMFPALEALVKNGISGIKFGMTVATRYHAAYDVSAYNRKIEGRQVQVYTEVERLCQKYGRQIEEYQSYRYSTVRTLFYQLD